VQLHALSRLPTSSAINGGATGLVHPDERATGRDAEEYRRDERTLLAEQPGGQSGHGRSQQTGSDQVYIGITEAQNEAGNESNRGKREGANSGWASLRHPRQRDPPRSTNLHRLCSEFVFAADELNGILNYRQSAKAKLLSEESGYEPRQAARPASSDCPTQLSRRYRISAVQLQRRYAPTAVSPVGTLRFSR
jgi:hypothetical protein